MAVMVMIVVGSGRERGRDDRSSEKWEVLKSGMKEQKQKMEQARKRRTDNMTTLCHLLPPCASLFILTAAWIIICLIREHLGLSLLVGCLGD
ncbi:hypothetical protein QQG55_43355 [Brugia pahangi]|uniref:Uncharacterized protein n=1 Tax=Brugia pahangi TaxID=6280 RepID=A0A0N4SXC6_BRUPA|nr:unnamed protein product [Brugia pahangi]